MYLTIEEILFIHNKIVTEFQPYADLSTVRDPSQLAAAVDRPRQTFDGMEIHQDDYAKASALTESIISGHPFQDGNKRVGITAGCVFLMMNGYEIRANNDDIYESAMNVAKGDWKLAELVEWFRLHFE